jgi:hypothetical protein
VTAARPGERVEVWFEDEARFGPKGTLTSVWAERGTRPTAPKQGAFGHLHVLTAVCPATGAAEGLVSPVLNAAVVQLFLDQLPTTIPAGTHVLLVWDGAGYHTAKALRPPPNRVLAGVEPGRAAVTVPAAAPLVEPRVPDDGRPGGGGGERVAGRLPERRADQDRLPLQLPVHRQMIPGTRMMPIFARPR